MKRRRAYGIAAGGLVVAAVLGVILVTAGGEEKPRSRQYGAFTSCLLTDEAGIGGPAAAPAWAGMQDASLASLTKVQHLSVIGEQTTDNAGTFVASMVQSRCNLVVLSGQAPGAAATAASARFPAQQFVAVGDQPSDSRANVTWVAGSPDAVRIKVRDAVLDAARAAER